MNNSEFFVVNCEIGSILVYANSGMCEKITFTEERLPETGENIFTKQLKEYLEGKRTLLDFPVKCSSGSTFMRIWEYLRKNVEYGKIITYKQ
ncbi:MAG: methylated-DNA--[protein]-cysteine S-methyltransferase, partial [Fervidobacterium sp.]